MNPQLNKKVKKYLDSYLRDTKTNSPEHQEVVMLILRGALTDANFHSEAKQLGKYFPKASNKYIGTPMEDVIESKGQEISKMAKWDGHDIIDAFAFYLSMSIGGSFGNRLMSLKESLEDPCWDDYEMVGMKKKNGKEVPNCVPKSEATMDENFAVQMMVAKAIADQKVKNPETKKDVRVTTALKDKEHPAHGKAKSLVQRLKDKFSKKESVDESVNEAYVVFYAKKKGDKPSQAAYRDKDMAVKFEKDLKKDGYITMMVNKKIKGVDESVNESDVKTKINRRGDVDGLIVTHKGNDYEIVYSSDFSMDGAVQPYGIVMPGDDVVSFLGKDKKAKSIWKQLKPKVDKFVKSNESVNESASRTAMEIGGLTGMNKDAIQKFVDDNKLDIEKVYQFVKKGKLADRMKLVSAIAGKPNNPIQKQMVKQFGESLIKEAKVKLGKDSVNFKVLGDSKGLTLIAATGNDLDGLQDAIENDVDVKEELRKTLEKQLKIPVEVDRGYEGAGFRFNIDFYSLAKKVK